MSETHIVAEVEDQPSEPDFEALVHVMASLAAEEYAANVVAPWDKNWKAIMKRLKTSLPLDMSVDEGKQTWRWRFNAADKTNTLFVVGRVYEHTLLGEEREAHTAAQMVANQPVLTKKDDRPSILGVNTVQNSDRTYQYPRLELLSRLVEIAPSYLRDIEVSGLGEGMEVLRPFDGALSDKGPIHRYEALQNLSSPLLSTNEMHHMRAALYYEDVTADASNIETFLRKEFITPDVKDSGFVRLAQVAGFLGSDQVHFDVVGNG